MALKRIERREYLDKLIALKDKNIIKIITGVRRCGKSTLMEIFQDYLRNSGTDESRIVAINFEDFDNYELRDGAKLHAYIKEKLSENETTYIFLDEIQHVEDFPRVVDSLFIKKGVDLYLTGSNAYMLSNEIATLISGRYIEINMLPFSFREFVEASQEEKSLSELYRDYISTSSFPYAVELKDDKKILQEYLTGIYNTIVVKDIASRKKFSDTMMLESVTRFVFDNIGNPVSTKKIADTMTSFGRKIDVRVVEKYIDALMDSFIVYQAKRYNIKGKQYLKTLEKYYVVDIGLRYALLGGRNADVGHILENVVYLELIRRGYEVGVGKADNLEIDFVAMDGQATIYFQVAATVRDEVTLRRELTPLQKINNHYQKFILTLDEDPEADYEGIRRINALNWLVGEV